MNHWYYIPYTLFIETEPVSVKLIHWIEWKKTSFAVLQYFPFIVSPLYIFILNRARGSWEVEIELNTWNARDNLHSFLLDFVFMYIHLQHNFLLQ